jgi:hypothetical protein
MPMRVREKVQEVLRKKRVAVAIVGIGLLSCLNELPEIRHFIKKLASQINKIPYLFGENFWHAYCFTIMRKVKNHGGAI